MNEFTLDKLEQALRVMGVSQDDAANEDYHLAVSDEQLYDLAFNSSVWSRFRRKFFGLNELEVRTLITIYAPVIDGSE